MVELLIIINVYLIVSTFSFFVTVYCFNGCVAGPFATEPFELNTEPWQGQGKLLFWTL